MLLKPHLTRSSCRGKQKSHVGRSYAPGLQASCSLSPEHPAGIWGNEPPPSHRLQPHQLLIKACSRLQGTELER